MRSEGIPSNTQSNASPSQEDMLLPTAIQLGGIRIPGTPPDVFPDPYPPPEPGPDGPNLPEPDPDPVPYDPDPKPEPVNQRLLRLRLGLVGNVRR